MPTIDVANPIQGYYYDSATDKLRPISGPQGPKGDTGAQGPNATSQAYFGAALGPVSFSANGMLIPISSPRLSKLFTVVGNTLRCDVAGVYHATASITYAGLAGHWVITTLSHKRGGTEVVQFPHVASSPPTGAAGFMLQTVTGVFDMLVNDTLDIGTSVSSVSSPYIQVDNRSTLTVVGVGGAQGATGLTGPQGPAGGGANKLDDLTDVTISGVPTDLYALAYQASSSQWIPTKKRNLIVTSWANGDIGSQSTGGNKDVVIAMIGSFTVPTTVVMFGYARFGYGAAGGGVYCSMDMIRMSDGSLIDGHGQAWSQGAAWTTIAMGGTYSSGPGVEMGAKIRINGINYNSQNCYMQAKIVYMVFET